MIVIKRDQAGVTEVAFTPEPRELQIIHAAGPEPEADEPEA